MRAIVCHRYGSLESLRPEEVQIPIPADEEVLIRVRAASVNPMDVHLLRGRPLLARLGLGLRRPKMNRPGVDIAGEVEAVGGKVTGFRPGDRVFGACRGAFAEFAIAAEGRICAMPPPLSFEDAAALPVAGVTALQGLRDVGKAGPRQAVLVVGAGGGIGSLAIQIAIASGARVTAVCSARHADLVRSLGAERVIDYEREDFTRSGGRYDLVFDLAGTRSFSAMRRILAPHGTIVLGGIAGGRPALGWMARWGMRILAGMVRARFSTQRLAFVGARMHKEDLAELARLVTEGKVRPAIGARYALADAGAALAYVAEGHAGGKAMVVP